jgi:peptidoglycan/LPS O-acetylase OafA/YrhL
LDRRGPLPALTGARFFAAFAVVVYHYGHAATQLVPAIDSMAGAGASAVSFFYVLSGAVMTWGCTGDDGLPLRAPKTFWRQRFARILPAYWLALALAIPPAAAQIFQLHPGAAGATRLAMALGAGLLLIQAFVPPLAAGLNTPGWSISCEAFFYALWPGLVGKLRRASPEFPLARVLFFYALSLSAPVLALALYRQNAFVPRLFPSVLDDISGSEFLARLLAYLPLIRLPEFLIGIALGHALRRAPPSLESGFRATFIELFLISLILLGALFVGGGGLGKLTGIPLADRVGIESGIFAPLYALLIWRLARHRGLVQRFLSLGPILLLGEASYALYILQEPLLNWFTGAGKRVFPNFMAHWSWIFFLYCALLIGVSLLVHQRFEMPLRARLLGKAQPPKP